MLSDQQCGESDGTEHFFVDFGLFTLHYGEPDDLTAIPVTR